MYKDMGMGGVKFRVQVLGRGLAHSFGGQGCMGGYAISCLCWCKRLGFRIAGTD